MESPDPLKTFGFTVGVASAILSAALKWAQLRGILISFGIRVTLTLLVIYAGCLCYFGGYGYDPEAVPAWIIGTLFSFAAVNGFTYITVDVFTKKAEDADEARKLADKKTEEANKKTGEAEAKTKEVKKRLKTMKKERVEVLRKAEQTNHLEERVSHLSIESTKYQAENQKLQLRISDLEQAVKDADHVFVAGPHGRTDLVKQETKP